MYNPRNVVAVDVNENNVTVSVFKDKKLYEVYRIKTSFGKLVIAYVERMKRVKVTKIQLRLAKLGNGLVLDRDVIGAL